MSDDNATAPAGTGDDVTPVTAPASHAVAGDNDDILAVDAETEDTSSITYGSLASSTTSVTSSVLGYRLENGRTYHAYKEGKYLMPNDDREIDRLDLQHNLFIRTFDDRLGTAPPNEPGANVGRVLDVGTGSGSWAIDFGDEHPEAEVLGVDLSAVQVTMVPPNVRFEIDDIEEPWTFSRPFDYIHSRAMTGSIANWRKYIQSCYDNLKPGGYFELNDVDACPVSDDGTLVEDSALMRAARLCLEAMVVLGAPYEEFGRLGAVMREVGFEDVRLQRFRWPTNGWPRDPKHKELGYWNYDNLAPNVEAFLMAPLTRALGWTREEVLILAMEVRKDLGNRNIHAYYNIWSIYGRKPSAATATRTAAA
ncbi:Putative S-adenosyl-L-methionine-dependent methyltransferase superfamily [Colletotrichum destructivum]|uniref:S-adenosyl-L-methionine-dependent methyltransferase superfamily n=1 Tax=Colletotrichum destructivum TaxID=34406 RepID=A0AAX4IMP3_9PEZI|nr:Putative S-adenosyl-L-methionine-dependent methyltransferase superfamily [Colletotrichum destructivum]